MTATEELRRLLDERGVEWIDGKPYGARAVTYFTVGGVQLRYVDYDDYQWLDYHENEPLTPEQAIAATLGRGTLTAEQVRKCVRIGACDHGLWDALDEDTDWQAISDELNAETGSVGAKNLILRAFGLAQMMYDCWLEECKAGDNVDISACNAYSYEFDQIAQAMLDIGIDPNCSDYYRSAELGSRTCELEQLSAIDVTLNMLDGVGWCECSNCGHATPDESNYCQHCGARIQKKVER